MMHGNPEVAAAPSSRRRLRVLVADGCWSDYSPLASALQGLSLSVEMHWVDNGEQVFAFLQNGRPFETVEFPDVLVIDPILPGLDGWEVLARLRREGYPNGLKVIMLCPGPQRWVRRRCAKLGVDALVERPVTASAFRRLLRAA
ncbi:MAG: response regulator [Magnetospirillum sp. WYHS-4]